MLILEIPHEIFPLLIALLCLVIPVVTLLFVVFIKQLSKRIKKLKGSNNENIKYLDYFGPKDNVVSVKKNLTRVTVEVIDIYKVDFDKLRELNIGVLIVGNTIKCSSEEFASQIEE